MSKKTTPLTATLSAVLSSSEHGNEHIQCTLTALATAERMAEPLLLRGIGLMSFHEDGDVDIASTIEDIANTSFGSKTIDEAISTALDNITPKEVRFKDDVKDLYNGYFTRISHVMKAAYCLGFAMGDRFGGVR